MPGGQGVLTLDPSHMKPAGHSLQAVRAVMVPPDVNELGGHVRQLAAPFSLHKSSAPHSVQLAAVAADHVPARHGVHERAPPEALVPAAHGVCLLVPSHVYPCGQRSQRVRILSSLKEPIGQSPHTCWFGDEVYLPVLHNVQMAQAGSRQSLS